MDTDILQLGGRILAIPEWGYKANGSWPDLLGNPARPSGVQPASAIVPDLSGSEQFLEIFA